VVPSDAFENDFVLNGHALFMDNVDSSPRAIFIEGAGIRAMSQGDHKIIIKENEYEKLKGFPPADKGAFLEIYDLEKDKGELSNLARTGLGIEPELIEALWKRKMAFAKGRLDQIDYLSKYLGGKGVNLYPERINELYEIKVAAGKEDRAFTIMVKPLGKMGSYLGRDFSAEDQIITDPENTYVVFHVKLEAGATKQFGFTPFPPDDPLTIWAEEWDFDIGDIYVGQYSIAYPGPPVVIAKERDFRLAGSKTEPKIDSANEYGVFLWRWAGPKSATTGMGGHVTNALRAWGYVK